MGKAYSDDLRRRVVAAMATGRSWRDGGAVFAVAPSTAGTWYRRYRRESSHAARPTGGDRRSKLLDQAGWTGDRLAQTSEPTLGEVRSDLAGRGIEVGYASVWRTVRTLGLRHKKGRSTRPGRTGLTSPSHARPGGRHRAGSISTDRRSSTRPERPPA